MSDESTSLQFASPELPEVVRTHVDIAVGECASKILQQLGLTDIV